MDGGAQVDAFLGHPGGAHGPELRLRDAAHRAAHVHEAGAALHHQAERTPVGAAVPRHVDILHRGEHRGRLDDVDPRRLTDQDEEAAQRHRHVRAGAGAHRRLLHGLLGAAHGGAAVAGRGPHGRHHERLPDQPPRHLAALRRHPHEPHQLHRQRVRAARAPRGRIHRRGEADAGRVEGGVLHQRRRVCCLLRLLPHLRVR